MYPSRLSFGMLGVSIISIISTAVILGIYLSHSYLRRKPYVQMVFYAALADFIGAISTLFGELEDGTNICVAQGILSNIFPLASVFWTLAIAYLLYANVVLLKPFLISRYLHLLCWGFPTLITLLMYTTNRIGLPDPDNVGWCFVGNTSSSPDWSMSFWTMMSFYIWIFISILAMLIILTRVHIETRKMKASRSKITASNAAQITVTSVYIYPAVVFLCWIIPCVTDMIDAQSTSSYAGKEILNGISSTLPLIQGFITSTVFCLKTSFIRRILYKLIPKLPKSNYNIYLSLKLSSSKIPLSSWKGPMIIPLGSIKSFRSSKIKRSSIYAGNNCDKLEKGSQNNINTANNTTTTHQKKLTNDQSNNPRTTSLRRDEGMLAPSSPAHISLSVRTTNNNEEVVGLSSQLSPKTNHKYIQHSNRRSICDDKTTVVTDCHISMGFLGEHGHSHLYNNDDNNSNSNNNSNNNTSNINNNSNNNINIYDNNSNNYNDNDNDNDNEEKSNAVVESFNEETETRTHQQLTELCVF